MDTAVAYNQSDIYKIVETRAIGVRPLFEEIENFDFETGNDPQKISRFIVRCKRPLELLSIIVAGYAAAQAKLDESLIKWLFDLSKKIDQNILANPAFASIEPEPAAEIKSIADDLAYAVGIIDLVNSKTINQVLANRGLAVNAQNNGSV